MLSKVSGFKIVISWDISYKNMRLGYSTYKLNRMSYQYSLPVNNCIYDNLYVHNYNILFFFGP